MFWAEAECSAMRPITDGSSSVSASGEVMDP
jgi:hypothetical protein